MFCHNKLTNYKVRHMWCDIGYSNPINKTISMFWSKYLFFIYIVYLIGLCWLPINVNNKTILFNIISIFYFLISSISQNTLSTYLIPFLISFMVMTVYICAFVSKNYLYNIFFSLILLSVFLVHQYTNITSMRYILMSILVSFILAIIFLILIGVAFDEVK